MNYIPTTYGEVRQLIAGHGEVKIANNTTACLYGDTVEIYLHGYNIIALHRDGSVSLRHMHHATHTTFERMKRFCPRGWTVTRSEGRPRAVHFPEGTEVPIEALIFARIG
jgi:hypothetical protein